MAEAIRATLQRKVFGNSESLFAVFDAEILTPPRHLARVVGPLDALAAGEQVELGGDWVLDPRFGRQFKATTYRAIPPGTPAGVIDYLSSSRFKGVGRKLAERIVDTLGEATLDILEATPDRLREVPGIGPSKYDAVISQLAENRPVERILVFLRGVGLGEAYAARVFKALGADAPERIQRNPYQLVEQVDGIGFRRADDIARSLGVEPDSPFRVRAGVIHGLETELDRGNLYSLRAPFIQMVATLLDVDADRVEAILDGLLVERRVRGEQVDDTERLFLPRAWHAERRIAERLRRVMETPSSLELPSDERAREILSDLEARSGVEMDERQREAVLTALRSKVFVLTGGPGTGKTTILRFLIKLLRARHVPVALAAPTGRAAKRLGESCRMEAKTLHRLLEFNPATGGFRRGPDCPLEVPFLLVDEASMIDAFLMEDLARALPDEAHLCLIGDVDQLPPVGPGAVLRDVIRSERLPVVRLNQIYRQKSGGLLVRNAHRINSGLVPEVPERNGPLSDFYFIERERPRDIVAALDEMLLSRIPERFDLIPDREVQVITPMYRGELGLDALNRHVQSRLNPSLTSAGARFRAGDKVMQIRNDYEREVFNGDIGFVVDASDRGVAVQVDERVVEYPRADWDDLVLAYAISVHKSQGSEFPAVVMPIHTQHFIMLRRNLLYTALTRGRRLAVLIGSRRALEMAVRRDPEIGRRTLLADRLREVLDARVDG